MDCKASTITFKKVGEEVDLVSQLVQSYIKNWKPVDCKIRKEPSSTQDHEVAAVRQYLENKTICRRWWLLHYFDSSCTSDVKDPKACCDLCAAKS